jgi:hypothetical protein
MVGIALSRSIFCAAAAVPSAAEINVLIISYNAKNPPSLYSVGAETRSAVIHCLCHLLVVLYIGFDFSHSFSSLLHSLSHSLARYCDNNYFQPLKKKYCFLFAFHSIMDCDNFSTLYKIC